MVRLLSLYYPILFVWMSGIVALVSYRKSWPAPDKWLAISIILIMLFDSAGTVLAAKNIMNHFLYNILYLINFMVISYFFQSKLEFPALKKLIQGFYFVFPLFAVVNAVFIQGYDRLNTNTFVIGGVFVLVLAVAYLWQLYISEGTENIFRDPVFWFTLAWLIYFSVSVPYLGMLNYLFKTLPAFTKKYFAYIFLGAIILYNIGITIGFLCRKNSVR